jgi:hypothetical protein
VVTPLELSFEEPVADVLNLGDVIEHLTTVEQQLPGILRLIKPAGLLVAQGPLEANANLFTALLQLSRQLRPRPAHFPPYHVMLATSRGQRALFTRFGLEDVHYSVSEVAWPAPSQISFQDLSRPRNLVLFGVRRLSQLASSLRPERWGNRYFYVGRVFSR